MISRASIISLLLAFASSACASGDSNVRDAPGYNLPLVHLAADTTPDLEIGVLDGPAEYQLVNAVAVRTLADGTVAITNFMRGYFELRYFDSNGGFITRAGRVGQGPWEVTFFDATLTLPGDSLLVAERSQRFHVFGPRGEKVRTGLLPPANLSGWMQASNEVLAARISLPSDRPQRGLWIPRMGVAWFHFPSGQLDTVAEVPYRTLWVDGSAEPGTTPGIGVPFGPTGDWVAGKAGIWVGTSDSPQVELYTNPDDPPDTISVARGQSRVPVTTDDLSRQMDYELTGGGPRAPSSSLERRYSDAYERAPIPAHMPLFESLKTDTLGRLWVLRYQPLWAERAEYIWDVFDTNDVWVATVSVPTSIYGTCRPYCAQLRTYEIGSDYLIVKHVDELGVQRIRRHALTVVQNHR